MTETAMTGEIEALVVRLRAHKPYNQFTDGPLVIEAADALTRLTAELARKDEEIMRLTADYAACAESRVLLAKSALTAEAAFSKAVEAERAQCAKMVDDYVATAIRARSNGESA